MGGSCGTGGLKSKSANHFKICPSPKKTCFAALGKLGPQSPKQEKNASVWQAKIKAAKTLNHEPIYKVDGQQVLPKAISVGDLKENKKPLLLKATHRPERPWFGFL